MTRYDWVILAIGFRSRRRPDADCDGVPALFFIYPGFNTDFGRLARPLVFLFADPVGSPRTQACDG